MKSFKDRIIRFFTIPLWLLVILCVVSFGSLILIFVYHLEERFYAYIDFVLSAYSLTALCFYAVNTFPSVINNAKEKVQKNKYVFKYTHDELLKTKSKVYVSLLINFVYIIINAFSAFYYKTAWFAIFAVYYTIIAVMLFIISMHIHSHSDDDNRLAQLKIASTCSVIMLTLNLILTASVLMILYQGRGFEQHGILIYVIALYTFYSTINAIIDVIKNRKLKKPIVFASTMIKLAEALVSMLLLETSMLAQFGAESTVEFKRLIISLTGGGVAFIITLMAVYTLVQSHRQLKK